MTGFYLIISLISVISIFLILKFNQFNKENFIQNRIIFLEIWAIISLKLVLGTSTFDENNIEFYLNEKIDSFFKNE